MDERVKELLRQMTTEEKAHLCAGHDFWHVAGVPRLGVAPAMVSDGPHGLRKQDDKADHLGVNDSIRAVCFPAGCATACSFDTELLRKMGGALGDECRAEGVDVLLGPAVNIKRSPLCGRNFEYYSEDPYLTGKIAAAFIDGVQSRSVGTSIKHFAANNQEYRRMSSSSEMSERTLREIYLAAFETAVKEARPWTVMASYNRINGVYACENEHLLGEILRGEWGYDGFVMSDWGALNEKLDAVRAGLELEMPGPCEENTKRLKRAVESGQFPEELLDRAAGRILEVLLRRDETAPRGVFDREADHRLAVQVEQESAVLLKNNGVLPLKRSGSVAYIGGFAETPRYQGGGSSHINASRVTSALSCAPDGVVYCPGFSTTGDETDGELIQQAVEAARSAETAVIFAGLPDSYECEGYDRQHMRLPDCQNELIARVARVQPNTVVALHVGSPVETPWADDVAAVLCLYLGGEGVGEAADALLYGDAVPSGRLAETWPLKLEDNPSYLNFPGDEQGVCYAEGVFVGYRYYDKKRMTVRWPFGHGESYTTFAYSDADVHVQNGRILARVNVTNTGTRAGKETVQLYVADRTGTPGRPEKELKGFVKLSLEPGQTAAAEFELDERSLSWYCERLGDWYAAPGRYDILFAHSSRDIRAEGSIEWQTERRLPLDIDRNTTVSVLLADPRTEKILQPLIEDEWMEEEKTETAREAITYEMIRQMLVNSPLRRLQAKKAHPDEWLQTLIDELRKAVS